MILNEIICSMMYHYVCVVARLCRAYNEIIFAAEAIQTRFAE